jgi:hypothetical protein
MLETIPSIEEQRANVRNLPGAPRLNGQASEYEKRYFNELYAIEVMNARLGVDPATVVNLNPFPLQVEHPLFRNLIVPACPIDKPYATLVIREVRYQTKDSEGNFSPVDFKPALLAKEFETQAENYGGVLVFRGDIENIAEETGGDLFQNKEFNRLYTEAKQRMIEAAKRKKQEADNEWNTPARAGARNITDMHRNYTRILLRERLITKTPEWLDTTRDEARVAADCPSCGSEPKHGAAMCPVCGWVIDPLKAWNIGMITDPTHVSLARLPRHTLDNLGITREHIPLTVEERDAQLKTGRPVEERSGRKTKPAEQEVGRANGLSGAA